MPEQDPTKLTAQANALVESGNLAEAVAIYQKVVSLQPGQAMAWFVLGRTQLQLGNIAEAESSCRQALNLQPALVNALFLLGNINEYGNNSDEAATYYKKVIKLEPGNAIAITKLGIVMHHDGELDTAIAHYQNALHINPYLTLAHFNLGLAYQENNQFSEAETCFRTVVRLQQTFGRAHAHLGYVLGKQDSHKESISAYHTALEFEPASAEINNNLGLAYMSTGQIDEAEECLYSALRLKPDYAEAYANLASLLQEKSNYPDAETCYRKAISCKPDYAEAHYKLSTALNAVGRQGEAVTCCQEALRYKPDFVDAHIALAAATLTLQKPDEAIKHCNRALELEPENINAVALAANIAIHNGDKATAYQRLKPLMDRGIDNIGPDYVNVALAFALISKDLDRQHDAITMLERILKDPLLPKTNQINLHFNLGKLYDTAGEYDKAFSHYRQGNMLKPLTFDAAMHTEKVDTLIKTYSPGFMKHMPRTSIRSDRPVFIVGMARSGTSLVEQILASHPEVFGAGELMDIVQLPLSLHQILGTERLYPHCLPLLTQEILNKLAQNYLKHIKELSPTAPRVIDKMPGNFMHLGLIELLFPDARIIHCVRDPLDTCLSCYFQDFSRSHPYSYDLGNLGAFYRDYQKIMQYWKNLLTIPMIEVHYEEMVANHEAVSRSLIEFCGLEWNEQCLHFHSTERFVGTASYDQVRQPIYHKSAGRWKNYGKYLESLKESLKHEH